MIGKCTFEEGELRAVKAELTEKFYVTNTGYNIAIRREMRYTIYCVRGVAFRQRWSK